MKKVKLCLLCDDCVVRSMKTRVVSDVCSHDVAIYDCNFHSFGFCFRWQLAKTQATSSLSRCWKM